MNKAMLHRIHLIKTLSAAYCQRIRGITVITKQTIKNCLLGIGLVLLAWLSIGGLLVAMSEQADTNARAAQQHLETRR